VTREELLGFRRALLQDIPVALRVRLEDIDHLLGWPSPEGAERRVAELEAALTDAIEGMEEMLPYVSGYFVEKWKLDEYIPRARAALAEEV
jgi:hypothetical protein